jgi:beta-glucosidase
MREVLGDRQPQFTPEEIALVKDSSDYYGMNTYTTNLISALHMRDDRVTGLNNLSEAGGKDEFQGLTEYTFTRPDGTQLGTQGHSPWLQACECLCVVHAVSILIQPRRRSRFPRCKFSSY